MEVDTNSLSKVALLVSGDDAEVFIDLLLENPADNQTTEQQTLDRRANRVGQQELNHMNSLLLHIREDHKNMLDEMQRMHERELRLIKIQNKNLRNLMRRPALMHGVPMREIENRGDQEEIGRAIETNRVVDQIPNLSQNPRSVHELWDEWQFGIGNRLPAKDFSARDRGKCKYTYHRRKVVWDKVSEMVRSGFTVNEACNSIYSAYGHRSSLTSIINQMRKDKKTGGHPNLRALNVEQV